MYESLYSCPESVCNPSNSVPCSGSSPSNVRFEHSHSRDLKFVFLLSTARPQLPTRDDISAIAYSHIRVRSRLRLDATKLLLGLLYSNHLSLWVDLTTTCTTIPSPRRRHALPFILSSR